MTSRIESDVRLQPNIMLNQDNNRRLEGKVAEVYQSRRDLNDLKADTNRREIIDRIEKIMLEDEEVSSKESTKVRYSPGPILLDGARMSRGCSSSLKSENYISEYDIQDPLCIEPKAPLPPEFSKDNNVIFPSNEGAHKPPLIRDENRVKIKRRGSNSCCSVS